MKRFMLLILLSISMFILTACQISSIEIIARENARESLDILSEHIDTSIDIQSLAYTGALISYQTSDGFNEERINYFIVFEEDNTESYAIVNYQYRYDPNEDRIRPDRSNFSLEVYQEMTIFESEKIRLSNDLDAWLASYHALYDEDDFYYEHDEITFSNDEIEAFLE